uniref:ShKT domain-containing protein n=1 Tax=Ditylenchus dipsaci TaxID=166011 RepID=A0A915E661_9BILA
MFLLFLLLSTRASLTAESGNDLDSTSPTEVRITTINEEQLTTEASEHNESTHQPYSPLNHPQPLLQNLPHHPRTAHLRWQLPPTACHPPPNEDEPSTTIDPKASTTPKPEEDETGVCVDKHDLCKFWSSIGECESNKDWMKDNCAISCDKCNGTALCLDRHRLCPFWSSINECETNAVWMLVNCARACKACKANSFSDKIPPNNGDFEFEESDCTFTSTHEDISSRRTVSATDVRNSNANFGCVSTLGNANCKKNLCFHLKFRSFDGTCNNMDKPLLVLHLCLLPGLKNLFTMTLSLLQVLL